MRSDEHASLDMNKIAKDKRKILLSNGFIASEAELEWAKGALAERPEDFDCIEDVIAFKRSYEESERGEGTVFCYKKRYRLP